MNLIPAAATAKLALTALKAQKHSPTIMFGVGVAGVVTTVIFASRATLKAAPILDEHKKLKEGLEDITLSSRYTKEDLVKDKALLLSQTAVKVAKLYTPAVVIGAASIGLLTGSHVMLNRRNAAVTAAYAVLDKGFREYRGRVREDLGEERERDIYRDVHVETKTVIGEDGKKKQVSQKVSSGGLFKFWYSELTEEGYRNPNWQEMTELNSLFLRSKQTQFNNKLQSRGHVFLNEVLDELGLERTDFGQSVGWSLHSELGDGYIDFGIFGDDKTGELWDFSTGHDDGIWLDFNVDGVILDQLKKKR